MRSYDDSDSDEDLFIKHDSHAQSVHPLEEEKKQESEMMFDKAQRKMSELNLADIHTNDTTFDFKNSNAEDSVLTGILEKRSPGLLQLWQKRFFVLDQKVLKYYKSETDYKNNVVPKGVLNFQQIWVEPKFQDSKMFINLILIGFKRQFYLKASKKEDYDTWKLKLTQTIAIS